MALKFDIVGDNGNFLRSLEESVTGVHKAQKEIEQSGMGIEDMFKRIATAAGIAFSLEGAKSFLTKVVEMRSYFQDIESSMEVFLGSAEKGQKFMEDLKAAAYYNMFEFTDLANASKQLIAYKNDIDTVIPTIQKLSDVAVGTSAPLLDLVNLYNKAKSTGKVSTQDLYSWAVKGVVVKDVLKEMGEEADGTAVTFEQLNKVLDHITSEGGMFYNLQSKMMSNISAEIGQFQDNLALMLNEIGEKYQDEITGAIKIGSELIDNYQVIAGWIKDIIVAYGTYRAALAVCLAVDKAVVYWKGLQAEATMMNTLANGAETKSVTALTVAKLRLTAATKGLTTAILANPYVLVAAGVATLTYAVYKLVTAETELEKAEKNIDESYENTIAEMKTEQTEIDRLFGKLRKAKEGTDEYKKVKDQILNQYGQYLEGLGNEIATLKNVEGAYKAVTKAAREASIARGKEAALKDVQETYGAKYSDYASKLQTALKSVADDKTVTEIMGRVNAELNDFGNITTQLEGRIKKLFEPKKGGGLFDANVYRPKVGQYLQALRNNEKYLKDYSDIVEQRFHIDEEEEKHEEQKQVRNKKAVEEEKKNLQAQLDALTPAEAAAKKGLDLKKKIQALEKELKSYNANDKSGTSTANDNASRRQKEFELRMQEMLEQENQSQQTRNAIEQARIAAIKNDGVREREAQDEQHRLNLQAVDNREEEMKKALYEYNKNVWENQNKDKTKKYSDTEEGKAGWESLSLTKDQQDELKALRDKENAEYARIVENRHRNELETMRDFLIQYGTFEQQKLAITKKYEKQIAEATTQGEKLSLAKERDSSLAQINAQSLAMSIDWNQTFSGIGSVLEEIAKETLSNVREYMKTDEYKKLDATDKQAYQDLVAKLIDAGGMQAANPFSTKTWDDISKLAEQYRNDVKDFIGAQQRHKHAVEQLIKAEEELEKATTPAAKAIAQANVTMAQGQVDATAKEVKTTKDKKDESQEKLNDAANSASKGLQNFSNSLSQITSGSLSGFATGVYNLINQISGSGKKFANTLGEIGGKAGGLIGAILQIIDALGDDPAQFIEDILNKIAKVIEKILSDLPQLIGNIFNGVFNIVGGVISGVGKLFGFDMGGIFGGTTENFDAATEKWSWLLDTWKDNLEYERSLMKEAYGTKVTEIQNKTEEQLKMTQQAAAEMYRAWASDGAGWFSHSNGYKANDAANWQYLWQYDEELAKQMGAELKNFLGTPLQYISNGDISRLFDLTPEQLKNLKYNNTQFWQSLSDEARQYLDMIIEAQEEMEKVAEEAKEQLTATSFDSIVSDFQNALQTMDSDADTFAENFEKYMRNAIINSLMLSKYKTQLEQWYKNFADAMESSDELTKQEQEELKRQYDAIVNEALEERDRLREMMNWTGSPYSQEASSKGFQSMSQDTGEELNGRFTALQIAGESINTQVIAINATLMAMSELQSGSNGYLSEIRNIMLQGNSFLEDIAKYSKRIYLDFHEKIEDIVKNTKNL